MTLSQPARNALDAIGVAGHMNKKLKDQIHREWQASIARDPAVLSGLFAAAVERLTEVGTEQQALEAALFLRLLNSDDFLPARFYKEQRSLMLSAHHQGLSEAISQLFIWQASGEKGLSSQCLLELLEPALVLYFYHGSSDHSPEVLASVAVLCVKFFTLFPECHNNLLLSLLAHHTQPPQAYADVLLAGVRHRSDYSVAHALAFDMFSKYAERDDPEHKHALATVKLCLPYLGSEEGIEYQHFLSVVFWSPLGISFLTQAQRLEQKQQRLALIKCKKIKADYKAELDELTQHFDVVVAREWQHAVKRVAVSRPTFNVILLLIKALPSGTEALKKLRDDVVAYRDRPKQFAIPKRPKSDIKDFALKLAVIEQLMYRQNVLSPTFDIHGFAAEYDKRQIDISADGYDIIPEAQKYFRNLAISPEQLAQVTELYFDGGMGGGASVYQHMWPFWDPGCGDEVIAVTTKAAADIQQLPNLKKVVGLEHFSPPVSVCRALVKHGVEQIEDN